MAHQIAEPGRRSARLPTDLWVLLLAAHLLLGFLCVLHFVPAFRGTTSHERGAYAAALVATANGIFLLIAAAASRALVRIFRGWGRHRVLVPRLSFAGRVVLTVGVVLTVEGVMHRIAGDAMGYIASLGVAGLIAMSAPKTSRDDEA